MHVHVHCKQFDILLTLKEEARVISLLIQRRFNFKTMKNSYRYLLIYALCYSYGVLLSQLVNCVTVLQLCTCSIVVFVFLFCCIATIRLQLCCVVVLCQRVVFEILCSCVIVTVLYLFFCDDVLLSLCCFYTVVIMCCCHCAVSILL